ncbi:hypothetical protein Misp01_83740 [Microtetraspora sp. NBRC 13810]|nr:hypothetical protein Misp01_83740 [Microtetraspora sp. NBRC 13810]
MLASTMQISNNNQKPDPNRHQTQHTRAGGMSESRPCKETTANAARSLRTQQCAQNQQPPPKPSHSHETAGGTNNGDQPPN